MSVLAYKIQETCNDCEVVSPAATASVMFPIELGTGVPSAGDEACWDRT